MKSTCNILLVDDHPFILEAYKNVLKGFSETNLEYNLFLDTASTIDETIEILNDKGDKFQIVFLDIRLPKSTNYSYKSGEDLGVMIKRKYPNIKVIIITGHNDKLLLGNILENLNPNGLLFKGDIQLNELSKAVTYVLKNIPYYSSSILNLLRQKISSNISLDKIDKKLLYALSQGIKTKDLIEITPFSIGGIEKIQYHR